MVSENFNLLVVGLGLIGGSIALGAKESPLVRGIFGLDPNPEAIEKGMEMGLIEKGVTEPTRDLFPDEKTPLLVMLSTPVDKELPALQELLPILPPTSVVTDAGSVKGDLVAEMDRLCSRRKIPFVGGHPIAGTEKSGVENAVEGLFEGAVVILTPLQNTQDQAFEMVRTFWESLGSRVETMDPYLHDEVFSAVSHLPHAVSYALVNAIISAQKGGIPLLEYTGGGFKDFTRIAASSPEMWRAIFLQNRENLLEHLRTYRKELGEIVRALEERDPNRLFILLEKAAYARRSLEAQDEITVEPRKEPFCGTFTLPGDKSISHRAVMLSALAEGESRIRGLLESDDVNSTISVLKALGVNIVKRSGEVVVKSPGIEGFREPADVLFAGNSGTTLRLMSGILASLPSLSVISGDASLRKRPMARVIKPLRLMGANISGRANDTLPPLSIKGGELKGIEYTLPVASAQVKSAVLLAGLNAKGETVVVEPLASRDHTERMLTYAGAKVEREGERITLKPGRLEPCHWEVPGDISSAAYLLTAATLIPGSEITIQDVGVNPTRTGFISILTRMGGNVLFEGEREVCGEPVAHITVRHSGELKGIEVGGRDIPLAIDEIPLVALLAVFAEGETVIRDAQELRVKESDRIHGVVSQLKVLGAEIEERPDGMVVRGTGRLRGGVTVSSMGDHRLAMMLALAGMVAEKPVRVKGAHWVSISFPQFYTTFGLQ